MTTVPLSDDLLLGAEAIDRHVFGAPPTDPVQYQRRLRRTYYMLERGGVPAGKNALGQWTALKSTIGQHFTAISSGQVT
jgi:hypothetical protein